MVKVEDEWERELESDEDLDLLFVTYDASRMTVEEIIEFIGEQGFRAELAKDEHQS